MDPSCWICVAGHVSENPHMEGGRSHPKPRQTHRGGVSQPRSNAQTRGPFCTRTLTHGVTSECPHSHRGGVHLRPRPTHTHRRGSLEGRPGYVRGLLADPGFPFNMAGTPIILMGVKACRLALLWCITCPAWSVRAFRASRTVGSVQCIQVQSHGQCGQQYPEYRMAPHCHQYMIYQCLHVSACISVCVCEQHALGAQAGTFSRRRTFGLNTKTTDKRRTMSRAFVIPWTVAWAGSVKAF